MSKLLKKTSKIFISLLPDAFVFGGLGALGYGLWLVKPWVAFTVVGFIIFSLGIFGSLTISKKGGDRSR
jgi:hypothetical protein